MEESTGYPTLDKAILAHKQAAVNAFRARREAAEKFKAVQRKEGIKPPPWHSLTLERLTQIEDSAEELRKQYAGDAAFMARAKELRAERDELEAALEFAGQEAHLVWIRSMPRSEKLKRERLTWESVQLQRAGGNVATEADLERLNPAFFREAYLPQKERMLQAERAAELAEEREAVRE